MNLLAPLFLVGAALVVGPILFHLIKQVPRNRIVFSSTSLLEKSEPKAEKSRRIQNPWLLLLRCLIICLLALAFARPFFPTDSTSDPVSFPRDVVIAIDRSASMNRDGIEEQVTSSLTQVLDNLEDSDRLSVLAFTDTTEVIVTPDQWRQWTYEDPTQAAERILSSTPLSDYPSHLDLAIRNAIAEGEAMRETGDTTSFVEIHLISDFSKGTTLSGLAGIEWPSETSINRIPVSAKSELPNIGIKWLGWDNENEDQAIARVSLLSSDPMVPVSIEIQAFQESQNLPIGVQKQLLLQGNTETIVTYPVDPEYASNPLRFSISGDSQPFDNDLYVAPEYVPSLSVTIVSDSTPTDPNSSPYFLTTGLNSFRTPTVTVEHASDLASQSDAYFVDVPLSEADSVLLKERIEAGANAFLLASSDQFTQTLRSLSGVNGWSLAVPENKDLLVGEVDFSHSLFSPFSDSRFSNFANIRTWSPIKIAYPSSVDVNQLASYDDESPLLLEVPIGQGKLFIWSSSWAPSASQWVLSSKFIPFLHQFTLLATGGQTLPSNTVLSTSTHSRYATLLQTDSPHESGLQKISENRWLAFQVSPEESQTSPISLDTWDRLGMPMLDETQRQRQIERLEQNQIRESETIIEQRQQVWKWLLWLVLALLAIESAVAISRNKTQEAIPS